MRWAWIAAVGLLLAVGCDSNSTTGGRTDSESHWLERCVDDSTCGALQCLCGVCAAPCDADACGAVAEGAVCADVCGGAPQCTAGCAADADCLASGLTCSGGACVAAAADLGLPDQGLADMAALDMTPPDMTSPDMNPPDMAPPDMAVDQGPPPGPCAVPGSTCQADGDCDLDQACAPAALGGACACLPRPQRQRVDCAQGGCCDDAECAPVEGRPSVCLDATLDAQQTLCPEGGAGPGNQCLADECLVEADCRLGQACVRPGQYGFAVATCVERRCRVDADCTERAGGQCTAFMTPCAVAGFWCTYADDPCRADADCPDRGAPKVCVPEEGGPTQCVDAPAP